MHSTLALVLLGALVVVATPIQAVAAGGNSANQARDLHSYSNPGQVRVTHVGMRLAVDFAAKILRGEVNLDIERQPGAPDDAALMLDTRDLTIGKVWSRHGNDDPVAAKFKLGAADPILGAPLLVELPRDATSVRIAYQTSPHASALQWLEPPLTAGKRHPFLFTQSEAIHARSWIPLQDSPGVRVTYAAEIEVAEGLTAVMSAERTGKAGGTFHFKMAHPIPSYLIALAVGELSFRPLSDRTGVFAEPQVVGPAAEEFADTPAMVAAAEKRYGPYRWGRYDLLVLPPSFPFGGMENPMLTFATPTVIAGDRSLVSLIAHELAHSWSGNLVTNATWRDFWLNEGFTTYIERRIVEDLFGAERAEMERVLGLAELEKELKEFPPRDQILHIDLAGRDPDAGMTKIPYDKGALFLTTLERAFGRERFDAFLRGYFAHFAFQSITTADFEKYLAQNLLASDKTAAAKVDVRAWLHEPGLPQGYPIPRSPRLDAVKAAAHDWAAGTVAASQIKAGDWSTYEWLQFLHTLPQKLTAKQMAELDAAFQLTGRGNAEVAHQWLLIAIRNGYSTADRRLESYLTGIGRRKLVVPLYTELIKTPAGRKRAAEIFASARSGYHPITVESVERLLDPRP